MEGIGKIETLFSNGSALPLPPNSGLPELAILICRSRIYPTSMGEGWGEGLRSQRRLTRFAAQIDLSPPGRGELSPRPKRFNQNHSSLAISGQNKNRPVLPGGFRFTNQISYSPPPNRRDHHPARRGDRKSVV